MKALFNSFLLLILSVTVLGQQDPQSHYGQIKKIDGFKSAYVDARTVSYTHLTLPTTPYV